MENLAYYILNEEDLASKMEIVYYLSKKNKIFYNKSVIFKTEIARLFFNYAKLDINQNHLLTECLLCNCKKVDNAQDINRIHTYAKEGADYLSTIGFEKKFCRVCEQVTRYSDSKPREKESDILELVDQFGGMLLDRPERIGFKPDEALVLLQHRNLKDKENRYLKTFIEFVEFIETVEVHDIVNIPALRFLVKIYNESEDMTKFIKKVVYEFEPKVDKKITEHNEKLNNEMFKDCNQDNRPLFSEETAKKLMCNIKKESETSNI